MCLAMSIWKQSAGLQRPDHDAGTWRSLTEPCPLFVSIGQVNLGALRLFGTGNLADGNSCIYEQDT